MMNTTDWNWLEIFTQGILFWGEGGLLGLVGVRPDEMKPWWLRLWHTWIPLDDFTKSKNMNSRKACVFISTLVSVKVFKHEATDVLLWSENCLGSGFCTHPPQCYTSCSLFPLITHKSVWEDMLDYYTRVGDLTWISAVFISRVLTPPPFLFSFFHIFLILSSVSSLRSMPGAGLHDLPWWVGRRGHPGHVRGADREILPGGLLCTLGLHAGHHGHPGCPHPFLLGVCSGQPADRLLSGWLADRQQRYVKHYWILVFMMCRHVCEGSQTSGLWSKMFRQSSDNILNFHIGSSTDVGLSLCFFYSCVFTIFYLWM